MFVLPGMMGEVWFFLFFLKIASMLYTCFSMVES